MVISAGNPVRLDPWQNIVGVGWNTFPFVAGTNRYSKNKDSGSFVQNVTIPTGSPAAATGDLLIVHATACSVGFQFDDAVITPPPGWGEVFFDTLILPSPPNPFALYHMGGGVWAKYLEDGDSNWDFTWNLDCPRTTLVARVVNARTSGFPAAFAKTIDTGDGEGSYHNHPPDAARLVDAPSVSPAAPNNLILTVVHEHRFYDPGRLTGTLAMTKIVNRGVGSVGQPAVSTWAGMFTENWSGPGATGTRRITVDPDIGRFFLATMAIAPPGA